MEMGWRLLPSVAMGFFGKLHKKWTPRNLCGLNAVWRDTALSECPLFILPDLNRLNKVIDKERQGNCILWIFTKVG